MRRPSAARHNPSVRVDDDPYNTFAAPLMPFTAVAALVGPVSIVVLAIVAVILALGGAFATGMAWANGRRRAPAESSGPAPVLAVRAIPPADCGAADRDASADANLPAATAFAGRVAHELRTPLNSVIGFAGVLLKNSAQNLNPQQMLYLSRIRDNGLHLLALVEHLMTVCERGAPMPAGVLSPLAVGALVQGTVRDLAGEAAEEHITLETEIPADVLPINTDAHQFAMAFRSLVRGALPLAEAGRMTVRVAAPAGRAQRIDIAVDGPAVSREPAPGEHGTTVSNELTLATSLYHMLGYPVTTERLGRDTATFSVMLDGPRAGLAAG